MKVTFLRIYKEDQNPSMKLYGDRLKKALGAGNYNLEISDFSPKGIFMPGVRQFWILNKTQNYLTRFWSYPRQLRSLKSDIYHIVDHANAYLMGNLKPGRVVITCHDLMNLKFLKQEIPLGYEDGRSSWFANQVFMRSCAYIPKAARLIADSEDTKRNMIRLLKCREKNIKVIYCGVDPVFKVIEDKEVLNKQRQKLAGSAKYILFNVGSSSQYKNFAGLIYALYILVKHYGQDIFLIRVGEVAKRHLQLIEKFKLTRFIRIIPEMPPEELNLTYNLTNLFIFPSLYEGFGWPTVEAMACGLPVVSSDKGGLKEAVEDAAYIVDPYDAKDIANGIIRVLENDSLRRILIQKGFQRASKLSLAEMAKGTYQIYQQLYY